MVDSERERLLQWVRALTGDASAPWDELYAQVLQHLDWEGEGREAAEGLLFETYWEARVPAERRRLYPGGASRRGFLGWGEDLEAVLAADRETLARLSVEPEEVGRRLRRLLDRAAEEAERQAAALPQEMEAGAAPLARLEAVLQDLPVGGCRISLRRFRGWQRCPFAGCQYGGKAPAPHANLDFTLTCLRTGLTISGPGFLWHLIEAHGFFGGERAPVRVEPSALWHALGEPLE